MAIQANPNLIETLAKEIRIIYNSDISNAETLIETYLEQRLKECTGLAEWVGFPKKGGSIEMGWEYQSSKMSVKKYKEWLKDVEHWWFEKFKDLPPTIVKMKGLKE